MLTNEVKKVSKEQLGYVISKAELRLIPYLQNRLMNSCPVDNRRINNEENKILKMWEEKGFVKMDPDVNGSMPHTTKKFYRAMSEILLVGYCSEWIIESGD